MEGIKKMLGIDSATKARKAQERERGEKILAFVDEMRLNTEILRRAEKNLVDTKARITWHGAIQADPNLPFRPGGKEQQFNSLKEEQGLTSQEIKLEEECSAMRKHLRDAIATFHKEQPIDAPIDEFVEGIGITVEEWRRWNDTAE